MPNADFSGRLSIELADSFRYNSRYDAPADLDPVSASSSRNHFGDVEVLAQCNTGFVVKNVGEEQIDSLRVEIEELQVQLVDPLIPARACY